MQQTTAAQQAVTTEFPQQIIFTFMMFKLTHIPHPPPFKASDSHPHCHFYLTLDPKEMLLLWSQFNQFYHYNIYIKI